MFILLSALAAMIPMLTYLVILWLLDKYDREPFKLIIINFLWGAVGSIVFAAAGSMLLERELLYFVSYTRHPELIGPLVVAPVVEESTKGIFLLITIRRREFDNITDGLVYGAAIGLGFGMTENFFYFLSYGTSLQSWVLLVVTRSMFSAVMHCISTGTFGAFLATAKFSRYPSRVLYPALGLILAILIHFTWNFTVKESLTILLGALFIIFASLVFLAVFLYSVSSEKKVIIRELSEESELNLFPKEHISILITPGRHRRGWVNEKIRKAYVKTLITLAFRKMQFRQTSGLEQEFYALEIENCRAHIKALLSNSF